jgi:hypothetical protein
LHRHSNSCGNSAFADNGGNNALKTFRTILLPLSMFAYAH